MECILILIVAFLILILMTLPGVIIASLTHCCDLMLGGCISLLVLVAVVDVVIFVKKIYNKIKKVKNS